MLIALSAVAAAAFLGTRAVAQANRELQLRDAAAWYETGRHAMEGGRTREAVRAFRKAGALNRDSRGYRLALADALAAANQLEAARQVLLGIRELAPEDADANLRLARLEAGRGDVTAAVRYYQNALYGAWPDARADALRTVRSELIAFLLKHGQQGRALSELLVLSANVPGDPASQSGVARLFLAAGDPSRALAHFRRTLQVDPRNQEALTGAGEAAFALGDYPVARRYLDTAAPKDERLRELQDVVDLVLAADPLRPRLPFAERRRRLDAAYRHAVRRLEACIGQSQDSAGSGAASLASLRDQARAFEAALAPRRLRDSPESADAIVELVFRILSATTEACGSPSTFDRALMLIGRRHGLDQP